MNKFFRRLIMTRRGQIYPLVSSAILETLAGLVLLETVGSVSCPFLDPAVWRLLVDEQLKRAHATGQHPQRAFGLAGPDSGLVHVPIKEWGGYVHIPYEGAAPADLFIKPAWRRTLPEYGQEDGSLSAVVHQIECPQVDYYCHHLLTNADMGDLPCATRAQVDEAWFLYSSKRPYIAFPRRLMHREFDDNWTTAPSSLFL